METAIERYGQFYSRLALPFLISRRPSWDKFSVLTIQRPWGCDHA